MRILQLYCTADINFQANYKDCIVVANMLDICLLRTDQGGDPELVRESQRRRYADVGLVDKVIAYDEEWRQTRGALDLAKKDKNATQKKIGEFMKKKETPPAELAAEKKAHEAKIVELEAKEKELIETRDSTLGQIGNLVPDDVPVDDDEDNNLIELIYLSIGVLKNLSSVEEVRRVKLTTHNVQVITHFLHFFPMTAHHLDKKVADT